MVDWGFFKFMMLRVLMLILVNMVGIMVKYLVMLLVREKVVNVFLVIRSCLLMVIRLISLVGLELRFIILVVFLVVWVLEFIVKFILVWVRVGVLLVLFLVMVINLLVVCFC